MTSRPHLARTLLIVVALAIVSAACSASTDDTTTSNATETTSSVATTSSTSTTDPATDPDAEIAQMCRTLDLLAAGGVPGPQAAAAMASTDLQDATSQQKARYGDILASAPATACPQHIAYAEDIAYWLGF